MKIATWNINGIKARLETVKTWLVAASPDIACFQEIKSVDENFPAEVFEELGYNVAVHGQKGFNGVALLSKLPFDEVVRGLPGDPDDVQARYIEGVVSVPSGVVRVVNIYLPNGNPTDSDKFPYKLAWMERLKARIKELLTYEEPFVVAGDYNVIPTSADVYDPAAWLNDALFRPESRAHFRALLNLGLTDAFRACHDEPHQFTFWDYQAGAWQKNHGLRIDHFLLSPQAADRLETCDIDSEPRGWEKPSDHVPVVLELAV
ncbi:MAG: exodeoxyribonuclease III [Methyloceanibacter sp.]|uniref:exodeoxyribonuclease III n=1 Tax=Methyloceanibacter sp. TaxID=1965321 RepID=UPI001DE2ED9D|nr:exodeoxyribonuclease III [Methyloceanibacter sp.]MCB1444003.1 exodeoxyribonuclease III [Methyloceanibacter sp.]MCC0058243.1 exodeoxyribonuclease III [Hyphomicrobiaceae bacterium]